MKATKMEQKTDRMKANYLELRSDEHLVGWSERSKVLPKAR